MKKKILTYSIFAVLLLTGFYVSLSFTKGFFDVKLPVMSYVQDFSFTDQNGQTVTGKTVDGDIYVTNYFFTTCKGICPKMNFNLKGVYDKFKEHKDFAVLSHSSMPETDSVPLLKAYEEKMLPNDHSNPAKWYFVTGDKDSLYKMARQSYLLDNPNNSSVNIDEAFIHTQFIALVDKQKRVRGIYDGLKPTELARLETDIQKLFAEKKS
ncbi:SCO family protein [Hanamia caeni]|jgi:protein SCO1/2|uniref:SCO family protein n=1 Tax=Hanamia caeni TaxID=2294116 RepID=A0A3M9NLY5_9BACT|nr:SCO family protein [Hanamia caeni]RNI38810.1 SCO family protein [Hanamia caeni]